MTQTRLFVKIKTKIKTLFPEDQYYFFVLEMP